MFNYNNFILKYQNLYFILISNFVDIEGIRLFERIKLSQRIQYVENLYEIYEGTREQQPILVYIILGANNEILDRISIINQQTTLIPDTIEQCYIGRDLYLVYQKPDLISLYQFLQENEVKQLFYVQLFSQLVQLIQEIRNIQLCINLFDPRYIYLQIQNIKMATFQIRFLSLFGISDVSERNKIKMIQGDINQDPWSQDLYNVGTMFQNLITKQQDSQYTKLPKYINLKYKKNPPQFQNFTGEIQKLLQGITDSKSNLRLTLDELIDHSLFGPQNQQISIQNITSEFKLEDFTFKKNIGQGSFGSCDIYIYNRTKEEVCIKQNMKQQISQIELEIMKLVKHPNVIRLYGSFRDKQYLYLVMEYANQGDLDQFVNQLKNGQQKLSEQQLLLWWSQLISAVYQLHQLNVIHRDIKHKNVLIKNNQLKLADFGISKISDTYQQTHIGSLAFMAPEQYWSKPYNKQIDIFSLGLLFYQMINPYFMNQSLSDMQQFYETVQKNKGCEWLIKDVPDHLQHIIASMMKNNPNERYTAEQLCQIPLIQKYLKLQNLPGSTSYQNNIQVKNNQCFTSAAQNKFIQQINNYTELVLLKFQNKGKQLGYYKKFVQVMLYRYLFVVISQYIQFPCQTQQKSNFDINSPIVSQQFQFQPNNYLLYLCRRQMNQLSEEVNIKVKNECNKVELTYKVESIMIISKILSVNDLLQLQQLPYKKIIVVSNTFLISDNQMIINKQQSIEIYTKTVINQTSLQIDLKQFILVFKKNYKKIQIGSISSNVLVLGQDAQNQVECVQDNATNQINQNIKIFNLTSFLLPQDVDLLIQITNLCYKQILTETIQENQYW